jgi:hypothetical protein
MLAGGDGRRIVRDAEGCVRDGRELFMRNLTPTEYALDPNVTPEVLARRMWAKFSAEADLCRPKGNNPKQK